MIRNFVKRGARGTALIAAIGFLVVGAAVPAQADEVEEHCIVLDDDGTVVCAPTLEEADAAFTAETGYLRTESDAYAAARGGAGLLAVYSLATFYQNNNYGGSSITITRSFDCNGVTVAGFTDLSFYGLNNAVSSFITYSSCQARLYDGTGYTGSTFGYATSQPSLLLFNDVASSARAR